MELLEHFSNDLIHSDCKKNELKRSIIIKFEQINKENKKNIIRFNNYLEFNKTIFSSNVDNLLKLPENPSKEYLDNLIKKTIDKINSEFILYIITANESDYSDINKIDHVICRINNSLHLLKKEIKIYIIKDIRDLKNINELFSLTLGREHISYEYDYTNIIHVTTGKYFTLSGLIYTLAGIDLIPSLITDIYGENSIQYSKVRNILDLIEKY